MRARVKPEEYAWLGFEGEEVLDLIPKLNNPLTSKNLTEKYRDDFPRYYAKQLRKPQYFSSICKNIFNIELLPIQDAILQELWSKPFPMFIASRGFGKTANKNTYIITSNKYCRIKDILPEHMPAMQKVYIPGLKLLGDNNQFNDVEYVWKKPNCKQIRITTKLGYQFSGFIEHPLKGVKNNKIDFIPLNELKIGDSICIDRNNQNSFFDSNNAIDKETAYLFGCLVGDGGYTVRGRIGLTTADTQLIEKCNVISQKLWNKTFKKAKAKYQYYLYSVDIWDNLFTKYGFNSSVCAEKDVPTSVLSGDQEIIAGFLSGLMDTDGSVNKIHGGIEFCSKSINLIDSVRFLLSRFGIICRTKQRFNKKYQRFYHYLYIFGDNAKLFSQKIGFCLDRKQNIFADFTTKISNPNQDILPTELVLDRLLILRDRFITNNTIGSHEYSYARQLLAPSRLKKYGLSYHTLSKILDIVGDNSIEHQYLLDILHQHYFYDKIVTIETITDEDAYDFYIPGNHTYMSSGFISHNSFLLALYATLKCFLIPESKIVIAGAGFRQSKIIFEYMASIWKKAPIFRQLIGSKCKPSRDIDRCTMPILDSWAVAIPIGTGDKIRGLRAHTIMCDEFAAINPSIYETVISGFAAVSKDPIDNVKLELRTKYLQDNGLMDEELLALLSQARQTNQSIISGTADYAFKHFAKYHKRYHDIIASQGDPNKLKQYFEDENDSINKGLNWQDYSIIRVPYEIIPKGFMDEKTVMRAKATMHSAIYQMEYGCVFVEDSQGFFRRTLIERCVGTPQKPIERPDSGPVWFDAMTKGSAKKRYVMGIDPASESNNFTIVILEVNKDHHKVVYCWSTNRKKFYAEKKHGRTDENDFYVYCCRKIRTLMELFPCARIGLDSQGGGRTIEQGLHSKGNLQKGEKPIYEVIDKENRKPTDKEVDGPHLVEMVNFADADWTSTANNGLKRAMEMQELIFPRFDNVSLGMSTQHDTAVNAAKEAMKDLSAEEADELHMILNMDSMEECVMEIEELKNELSTIEMKPTLGGRDRWSTPEIVANGKKSKMNKDRYSSILMAYMMAVQVQAGPQLGTLATIGRLAKDPIKTKKSGTIVDFYHAVPKRGV